MSNRSGESQLPQRIQAAAELATDQEQAEVPTESVEDLWRKHFSLTALGALERALNADPILKATPARVPTDRWEVEGAVFDTDRGRMLWAIKNASTTGFIEPIKHRMDGRKMRQRVTIFPPRSNNILSGGALPPFTIQRVRELIPQLGFWVCAVEDKLLIMAEREIIYGKY